MGTMGNMETTSPRRALSDDLPAVLMGAAEYRS